MKRGEYDVIDTIFYTEERAPFYDFSKPYARIDVMIFFNNQISGISGAQDLKGFRVAGKAGDANMEFLRKRGINGLVYYDSYEEVVQAAARGEEHIFVMDEPPALYYLYKYELENRFNRSAPLFSGEFHRAVKKGNAELLALVEEGFAAISKEEYERINNRWLGTRQESHWREFLPYLLTAAIVLFAVIVILLLFARVLQKRVAQRTLALNLALASLQKNERKYREIFNAATEAIFVHAAPGGQLLHVNESMLRMYGYDSEEEVLSCGAGALNADKSPYTEEDAAQKMRLAMERGPQVFEWLAKRKNGELFWAEVSLRYSKISGEEQFIAVVRDISKRKQAEEALRESQSRLRERERQYRALVEQIPAIVHLDDVSDGIRTVYISPQVEKILGYTPQEWIEKSPAIWNDNISAEDRESVHEKYLRCIKGGEPFEAEYRLKAADGRTLWLHDQAVMLRGENGGTFLIHGVIQDITARKQSEMEMRRRVMELETVYESGLVVNRLLDPAEIGAKIIEILERKLGWNYAAALLYHPQDKSLELLAFNLSGIENEAERREAEERFRSRIYHSSQGINGWVVRHKQIVRLDDVSSDPRYVEVCRGSRSGLYAPMMMGERAVGVLSIESSRSQAFSAEDERLVATLANQTASALENARLFKAEQKQRKVSDALRGALSAGASLSASLNFETILDRLLESLERVVPFDGGSIMMIDEEKGRIRIARLRGYAQLNAQQLNAIKQLNFDVRATRNLRWILENRQPLIVCDVESYEGWIYTEDVPYARSWAGAPIIVNGEVIALFSLDSVERNFFTEEHAELLKAFTGQASLALQNARLFEQTERGFREFAALYETSQAIATQTDLSALLQTIVERAQALLNSASSGIYLYDSEKDELELSVDTGKHLTTGIRLKMGEGAAGRVAQTRQPLRIDDYSVWEGRSPQYKDKAIRAVLEVPILYGGELIGVLTADEINDSERKFTEADERLLSLFASQAAGAIHAARLREQTERRLGQLQALHTIDRAISSSFSLKPILNTVIAQTIAQLNVDAAGALLYQPHLKRLDYVAGQGFRTRAIEQTRLRLGECFSGRAALERRLIHVPSLAEAGSAFTRAALLQAEGFVEFYAVPLIAKSKIKGVLEVFHRSRQPRSPEWFEFLETLAGQAAITIEQTQLFEDLQRANLELAIAYDATIEGWARAMDLRDKETENHTERVTELAISLARMFGVKDSEMAHLRRGALLHDIGKIGVPDNILLKKDELTAEEWEIMKRHPQFAYEMLSPIEYLRRALDIPRCHHEKWDGTGYPRGLRGEEIPLAARIFAIADVWDALTSDRPYRSAWSREKALSYIKEQSGKHFDPQVVEVFLRMMER
jgi:PAS domain S-box-containing protein/putative nucleotidyltransferase with HDIG domain